MSDEKRFAALEARMRKAEDYIEILNLLNRYGPCVDSGSAAEAASLWIEGGTYEYGLPGGEIFSMVAPDDHESLYGGEATMAHVANGGGHITLTPRIRIDGDAARAVGYTLVVQREGDRWFVERAAVSEWKLVRVEEGWRIQRRFNRALDGSPESHDVMRRILTL